MDVTQESPLYASGFCNLGKRLMILCYFRLILVERNKDSVNKGSDDLLQRLIFLAPPTSNPFHLTQNTADEQLYNEVSWDGS